MHFKKLIQLFFSNFSNLILSDDFIARHRKNNSDFTRDSKLCFSDIILFLMRLPQKTLATEMSDFVSQCLGGKESLTISKQAFCVRRQKILPSAFAELLSFSYQHLQSLPRHAHLWHGHVVKAIDGTTLRVPNTPENRIRFQTQSNQYGEVPLIKVSTLYNVSQDLVEDVVLGKYKESEKAQALRMLSQETLHDGSGRRPIITFDRGYPSGELIHHIIENNGIFLIRCPAKSTFKNVLSCPQGDSETVIFYKKHEIRLRVIRFFLESGEEEILLTNLFDSTLDVEDFKELYALRWKIEVKYREVKQQLKTENFASKKADSILQEVYASLVFTNIASVLKFMVDVEIMQEMEGKKNKYEYHANRGYLFHELKKNLHSLLGNVLEASTALDRIVTLAKKERSSVRPGRKWERRWHKYSKSQTYCMNQRTAI